MPDKANEAKMQSLADLGQAQDALEAQRKAEAERDRLLKALGEIQGMGFDMPMTLELTDEQWARRRASLMQQIAAAALGETEHD